MSPLFSENVKNNTDHQINNSKTLPNPNFQVEIESAEFLLIYEKLYFQMWKIPNFG